MILLFGATGQLGRALQAEAAHAGNTIDPASFIRCDVADTEAVFRVFDKARATLVLNAAGYTAVDRAESEPDVAERVNVSGAETVAGFARAAGLPLIHISTDYVFDGRKTTPYLEDDPVAPLGAYGRSKEKGETAVRRCQPKHLIMRTSWLYSPYRSNFVKTMLRVAESRSEVRVVRDQFGTPTSATDLARACLAMLPRVTEPEFSGWGTYHYAGEGVTSWYEFACRIFDVAAPLTALRPLVTPISTSEYPTACARPRNSALDTSRLCSAFKLTCNSWQSSVERDVRAILKGNAA